MASPAAATTPRQNQKMRQSARFLAPLAPVFSIMNWIAFVGWLYVLYQVISFYVRPFHFQDKKFDHDSTDGTGGTAAALQMLLQETKAILVLLEGICVVEVGRILFKDLPGNLTLGVILHTIRITALVEVLPRAVALAVSSSANEIAAPNFSTDKWTWTVPAVLLSWAVTEVGRYPMYLAPSNRACRTIRMVLPLITFPMGAFAEFCTAHQVLWGNNPVPLWLQFLLILMMLVNGVLGPYLAYPHLLKKGLPVLGLSSGGASSSSSSSSSAPNKKPKLRSV